MNITVDELNALTESQVCLRSKVVSLENENLALRSNNEKLLGENEGLLCENEKLKAELNDLRTRVKAFDILNHCLTTLKSLVVEALPKNIATLIVHQSVGTQVNDVASGATGVNINKED